MFGLCFFSFSFFLLERFYEPSELQTRIYHFRLNWYYLFAFIIATCPLLKMGEVVIAPLAFSLAVMNPYENDNQ